MPDADADRGRFGPYTVCHCIDEEGTVCEASLSTPTEQQSGRCRRHDSLTDIHCESFDGDLTPALRDTLRDDVGLPGETAYALATVEDDIEALARRLRTEETLNVTSPNADHGIGHILDSETLTAIEERIQTHLDGGTDAE